MASSFSNWSATCRLPMQSSMSRTEFSGSSSFGMSGVNAHAIIRPASEQPLEARSPVPSGGWRSDMRCFADVLLALHPLLGRATRVRLSPLPRGAPARRACATCSLGSDLTAETDRCMLQTKHALQFKLSLGAPALAFLWDHQVQGSAIVPGAAYMEAAIAAGRTLAKIAEAPCALVEAAIAAPCQLPKADGAALLLLTVELDWAEGGVSVRSSPADARKSAAGTLHLRGSMLAVSKTQLAAAPPAGEPAPSAEVERAACCDPLSTQAVYSQLNSAGLEYGARFRCVDPQSCTPGREGPPGVLRRVLC